jgi:hypothetical protein
MANRRRLLPCALIMLGAVAASLPNRVDRQPGVASASTWSTGFEPNRGQFPAEILFASDAPAVRLTRQGARLHVPSSQTGLDLSLEFLGARSQVDVSAEGRTPGLSHYYSGADRSKWLTDIPHYERVLYKGVWDGIDVLFHTRGGDAEYDFIVAPGGDPNRIRLRLAGAKRLRLASDGDLAIVTDEGEARQHVPVAFQESNGKRRMVQVAYRLRGNDEIALALGDYDRRRPLVIDPVLVFGTYLHVNQTGVSENGLTLDALGNVYLAGAIVNHSVVTKLSPNGQLLYATHIIGGGTSAAEGVAVDAGGNAWVAGYTTNPDDSSGQWFPRTIDAVQFETAGGTDTFILKLSPSGTLVYSTLLGTAKNDFAQAIKLGADGSIYAAGTTSSDTFPNPRAAAQVGADCFVAKLAPSGRTLTYFKAFGGSRDESIASLSVDSSGRAWVGGWTSSADFPLANAFQPAYAGGPSDGFVARLDATGTQLEMSSWLGGSDEDEVTDVALDRSGALLATGRTLSANFPQRNPIGPANAGSDGFLSKILNNALSFSTALNRNGGSGVAVGPDDAVYLTGGTPLVARMNPALTAWDWVWGGYGAWRIAVDAGSNVVFAGTTVASSFPSINEIDTWHWNWDRLHYGFVVGRLGPGTPTIQHEETDPAITYSGDWSFVPDPEASGGQIARCGDGARATIDFSGSGIQLYGRRDPSATSSDSMWAAFGHTGNSATYSVALHSDPAEPRALLLSIANVGSQQLVIQCAGKGWLDGFTAFSEAKPTPTPFPITAVARIEDNDARIRYSGSWYADGSVNNSGGSARLSTESGDTAALTFTGTGVSWIGLKDPWSGIADVFLDGSLQATVDTYDAGELDHTVVYSVSDLPNTSHTLQIQVAGRHDGNAAQSWVWVDAFDVTTVTATATPIGGTATSTPIATSTPTPTPTVRATVTATATATASPTATPTPTTRPTAAPTATAPSSTRIEETDSRVVYTGVWYVNTSPGANHSGGSARLSTEAGDTASLTFTGTGITWIGLKDPWAGIANVYLDGTLRATIDTYSATEQDHTAIYSLSGLAAGPHTIQIQVTGNHDANAAQSWVWLDAFDVMNATGTTPPTATPTTGATATSTARPTATATPTGTASVTRIDDTDSRVAYSGTWYVNTSPGANHSGGSAQLSTDAGDSASLTFTGTGVTWIGLKDPWAGIANVYLDGTLRVTIDTYSATEQDHTAIYSASGLAAGSHTLRIQVTGNHSASAAQSWIWVDAFDVVS